MRIFPLGDNALTVEFSSELSDSDHRRVVSLSKYFDEHPFPGFVESIPAYTSVTIFYDLVTVRNAFPASPTAAAAVEGIVRNALVDQVTTAVTNTREITVPVNFDPKFALDLNEAAEKCRLTCAEFIEIFLARSYTVFMLGFLPGFAYMGEVDKRIAVGRKESPRSSVPKGSVGIAGRQTGIYPIESPGGWNIIGRTNLPLFDPTSDEPCLFRIGDRIRFVRTAE